MKIAGGKLKPSSFQQKKIKKIGPSGVKLRACKRRHSKTKFTPSYGLSGSNGLSYCFLTWITGCPRLNNVITCYENKYIFKSSVC